MRPPTWGSMITAASRSPETVWAVGHQVPKRAVQVVKAWRWSQATSTLMRSASGSVRSAIGRHFRRGVLGDEAEAGGGLAPHAADEALEGGDPFAAQAVDALRAGGHLADQAGVLQEA